MKKKEYIISEEIGFFNIHTDENDPVCAIWKDAPDKSEPFRLSEIALDAFNTSNKCGLLPSELLKQRDSLLHCVKALHENKKDLCEGQRIYVEIAISQIEQ